ncbi:hypothetical protein ACLB2K_021072 [Fragaria x ananassa]
MDLGTWCLETVCHHLAMKQSCLVSGIARSWMCHIDTVIQQIKSKLQSRKRQVRRCMHRYISFPIRKVLRFPKYEYWLDKLKLE